MISRLTLQNWRNYDDLAVDLGPGTTFVVASNGVGKTSLIEAARWALFNVSPIGGASAIRAGAEAATASVELILPDARALRVTRVLSKKTRGGLPSPTVTLDDADISPDLLAELLIGAYKAEPSFLASLTMPSAHPHDGVPSKLGLEDHLGQYYGVNGLRQAVDRLRASLKETDAQIKEVKAANSVSADAMAQLEDAVEQTASQMRETTERHQAVQHKLERAKEQQRHAAAVAKWHQESLEWTRGIDELATLLSAELSRKIAAADFDVALSHQIAVFQSQSEDTRVAIGVNRGREQAIRTNQARLDSSEHDCPVCRRPLDEDTVALAHSANDDELSTIAQSLLSLQTQESNLNAALQRLKRLEAQRERLRPPADKPADLTSKNDEGISAEQLQAQVEQALSAVVEARALHIGAVRALEDARSGDQALHELRTLFRRQASIHVAVATTESTLSELLNETIRPLAVEVDLRWKALFPGRGDLTTTADGGISRMVNGHPLPYDSFSTGEGMGATILMRLLVAQMATSADFCWFDEPLEHLDPDVRRRVANLLSRVTTTNGPIRQVVVTTYEEPLARHLEARDPLNVKLIDVRQAG